VPAGNYALLLLQTLPLVVRRRFPVAVWAVCLGATLLRVALAVGPQQESLGVLVALYTVAAFRERPISVVAAAATLVGILGLASIHPNAVANAADIGQTVLMVILAWALGDAVRLNRFYRSSLEDRAERLVAERESAMQRAVDQERARIARELHDVVAHHLSVIVVQAGAGLRAFAQRPAQSRQTLEAIDTTAREALGEMRRMLSILQLVGEVGERHPIPGLANLGALLDGVRGAGLAIDLKVEGEPRPLDASVDLSAYRIIQEALTNTLRHSRARRAAVSVRYQATGVEVEVTDNGPTVDERKEQVEKAHPGRGLIGMRERVALFSGQLEVGPLAEGGYRVIAQIPLHSVRAG
jgi:signal transduction histidine kinase